jgi:hypothetical protein
MKKFKFRSHFFPHFQLKVSILVVLSLRCENVGLKCTALKHLHSLKCEFNRSTNVLGNNIGRRLTGKTKYPTVNTLR